MVSGVSGTYREEFVLIGDQEDADGGGLPNQN